MTLTVFPNNILHQLIQENLDSAVDMTQTKTPGVPGVSGGLI